MLKINKVSFLVTNITSLVTMNLRRSSYAFKFSYFLHFSSRRYFKKG